MNPAIGHRNIARTASAISPFNARLAFDGLTHSFWEGPAFGLNPIQFNGVGSCDYVAVARHNLSGGVIRVLRNSTLIATFNPASNRPAIFRFNATAPGVASWLLEIAAPGDRPRVGVLHLGQLTELPRGVWAGHQPPNFNRTNRYLNNLSDSGQWLGRKRIADGTSASISVQNIPSDWMRTEGRAMIDNMERFGFFWQHNPSTYPGEVAYCWTTDDPSVSNSRVGGPQKKGLMDLSISAGGIVE